MCWAISILKLALKENKENMNWWFNVPSSRQRGLKEETLDLYPRNEGILAVQQKLWCFYQWRLQAETWWVFHLPLGNIMLKKYCQFSDAILSAPNQRFIRRKSLLFTSPAFPLPFFFALIPMPHLLSCSAVPFAHKPPRITHYSIYKVNRIWRVSLFS